MIYLYYGEDKYRLTEELQKILASHRGDAGDINISQISEKFDFASIKSEAESLPFLSDKRLLIIRNLMKSKDKTLLEKVAKWLPDSPISTDIVFIEDESPDQRTALYKSLVKNGNVREFNELKSFECLNWIKERVKIINASIDPDAASILQLYCGSDLSRLSNEIDKLANYNQHITKLTVEKLVDAGFFNTIFELTDAISEKRPKQAMNIITRSMESGENEIYLVSMLARQVRNLLIIKDLSDHRLSESEIARKTKLHPFVIKKTLLQSKNFTTNQLLSLHGNLIELDLALKSINTDPKVLLQKFVAEMSL